MSESCVFCQIVQGIIPAHKIYEDEFTMAFMDKSPVARGHVLIVPKDHYALFEKMEKDDSRHLMDTLQRVGRAVMRLPNVIAYNIRLNNGPGAGQVVEHVHFHVIPRYADDGLVDWKGQEYSDEEVRETRNLLIKNL